MAKRTVDVLIVGAGPVGLFCANEVMRHGLNACIIDKKQGLSEHSKALGIHIRTLDLMEDCGFLEDILKQGHAVNGVVFKSYNKHLAEVSFEDVEASRHFLIDLPQNKTERILAKGLETKHLNIDWQTELTAVTQSTQQVIATLQHSDGKVETIEASWLIACDGGHSIVRSLSQIRFKGSEYKHRWWLADLFIDWTEPADKMMMYIGEDGPLACFPMGNSRYRLVMTAPLHHNTEPTLEDIRKAFQIRSKSHAHLSDPIWLTQFYLHHRQIEHYRKDRIFFAGDAAHIHSPIGGQGLNTGIQDIYNLVWKLSLVHKNQAHASILDSYHLERYPIARNILRKTDQMTKMIVLKKPWLIHIRNALLSFLMSVPSIKNKIATEIAELAISYKKSPIVAETGARSHYLKAGELVPDLKFFLPDSEHDSSLYQLIKGTEHHLLLFSTGSNDGIRLMYEITKSLQQHDSKLIIPHLICSNESEEVPRTLQWIDKNNDVHKKCQFDKPSLVLIRPDKYIGYIQIPARREEFFKYLERVFLNSLL